MCELLGMSANVPTDIVFSFTGLMQRGGRTGPHRDGWGIGFYEGRGLRLFQDPAASSESEVANLVQRYPIKSEVVIGHIRQANVGRVCLSNTHPFVREMWGRNWCFAHNGQLGDFKGLASFYRPVGDTDSEAAFCDLLNRIRSAFPEPVPVEQLLLETDAPWLAPMPLRGRPNSPALVAAVYDFVAEVRGVDRDALAAQVEDNVRRAFPKLATP